MRVGYYKGHCLTHLLLAVLMVKFANGWHWLCPLRVNVRWCGPWMCYVHCNALEYEESICYHYIQVIKQGRDRKIGICPL
jgi:hypothetical protein